MESIKPVFIQTDDCLFWRHEDENYCLHITDCDIHPRHEKNGNVSTIACFHPRYSLGDPIDEKTPDEFWLNLTKRLVPNDVMQKKLRKLTDATVEPGTILDPDDILTVPAAIRICEDYAVIRPVFLYDHSGISLTIQPVDRWDSSLTGWIVVEKSRIEAVMGEEIKTHDWKDFALQCLNRERNEYYAFINGECFQATVLTRPDGCTDDSAWEPVRTYAPFYGDDLCTNDMLETVEYGLDEAFAAGSYTLGHASTHTSETITTFYRKDN